MASRSIICFILGAFAVCTEVYGQEDLKVFLHPDKFYKKYFPHLKVKHVALDTSYIKAYPNYLSVGIHVLSPALYLNLNTRSTVVADNTAIKLRTNVADILGFSANYRYVSVGFAFLLKQGIQKHDDYAPSSYHTATIKYNNPIYSLQFKYLKLKGFTDINTVDINIYGKRPDITNREYQFEGVYNFNWKKYSYLAPLTFSQRQIKSSAGVLLKGGLFYKKLSGDFPLINPTQQLFYEDFSDTKAVQTFSIKLAPGVGGNLVFHKRIYMSMAVFTSFDLMFYRYFNMNNEASVRNNSFVFSVDGYASIGYQSQRIYAGIRYEVDRRNATLRSITMRMINSYLGFEFGYRFDTPGFVKKFYKKTMPPGL